jgi:anthranilate/para-aminobenzoate synthase component I
MSLIRQSPISEGGFMGGLVGYVGYDSVRYFEKLPSTAPDNLKVPDMCLLLADKLVVFDHLNRTKP